MSIRQSQLTDLVVPSAASAATAVASKLCAVVVVCLISISVGCTPSPNEYVEPPPPPVTVAHPLRQRVTDYLEENGLTEPVEQAEVRSRVRGFVEEIAFEPGQEVAAGDVLYQIEKEQYEAKKNSAEATVAASKAAITVAEALVKTADAELARVSREFDRQKELLTKRATSQAEYDTIAASFAAASANLRSTRAGVDAAIAEQGRAVADLAQAQLDFDYTVVRAPIAGRITKTSVKLGNLVENGTILASVVDHRQTFVNFNISDRALLRYRAAAQARLAPGEELEPIDLSTFPIYLRRETDQGFPFAGHLEYADQEGVDARTGTLAMRAIFENPVEDLLPGLFVQVRLPLDRLDALLIPGRSVGRDQQGAYVLTVDSQQKVERKPIVIAREFDGWVVVESGLTTDDLVVVEGIQRARPGTKVAPQEKTITISDQSLIRGLPDKSSTDSAASPVDAAAATPVETPAGAAPVDKLPTD